MSAGAIVLPFAPRRRASVLGAVLPAAPSRPRVTTELVGLLEQLDVEQQQIVELVILPDVVQLPASTHRLPVPQRLLQRLERSSDEALGVAACVAQAFVRGVPGRAVRNG